MRSQKQVRRIGKVRSMKNAAAGKWKTYRKRQEARKAWQNNTMLTGSQYSRNVLAPPPSRRRRIKEPKQRSPEQLAERQRLREQKRMAKKLAKQRASTSILLETKKEKKPKKVPINDSKKISAEQKKAVKVIKTKNSMVEKIARAKRSVIGQVQPTVIVAKHEITAEKVNALKPMEVSKLQNNSKSKQQYLKAEKPILIEEQKMNHFSSPIKLEQKDLIQSTKRTDDANETDKKRLEKAGLIEEIVKEGKNGEMQLLDSVHVNESQEHFVPTALHSISKEIKQDYSVDSDVAGNAKVGRAQDFLKEKTLVKKRETVQQRWTANKNEHNEVRGSAKEIEVINEEQKKKKRNQRLDPDSSLSEQDFVEIMTAASCARETKHEANVKKKDPVFLLPQIPEVNHMPPPIRGRVYKLLPRDVQFCVRMIERHGEDYEAMAKDKGNIFGDSAKGIARKIRVFKESPEYEAYLRQKAERNGEVA